MMVPTASTHHENQLSMSCSFPISAEEDRTVVVCQNKRKGA